MPLAFERFLEMRDRHGLHIWDLWSHVSDIEEGKGNEQSENTVVYCCSKSLAFLL